MKKQQEEYKVNLIGEQDLRKLTKEELELLVAAFVKAMSIEKCNHDKDKWLRGIGKLGNLLYNKIATYHD